MNGAAEAVRALERHMRMGELCRVMQRSTANIVDPEVLS